VKSRLSNTVRSVIGRISRLPTVSYPIISGFTLLIIVIVGIQIATIFAVNADFSQLKSNMQRLSRRHI
jgi:hypothetical protein